MDAEFASRCERAALVSRRELAGFETLDVERVRLVRSMVRQGLTLDDVSRVERDQGLLGYFLDEMFPSVSLPNVSLDEAAERVGLTVDRVARLSRAAGLGDQGGRLTDEDVESLLGAAHALRLGFPEEALAQLLTVFADALGRVAETEARLFHFCVHERLRAEGLTGAALMSSTMATSEPLTSLVEPALRYFHRKGMARAVRDDAFLHFAAESGAARAPEVTGQLDVAICFVDLAGFTSLTDTMGDLTAIEVLARFSMLVRAAADEQQGRVIKQIGDEFMLVFGDPVAAVRCSLDIQRRVADEPRFLGTRVGVHVGPVLYRQGDYFGATVNLAARLTSAARDQVLVSHSVRVAIGDDPDLRIVPLGVRDLQGIADDLEVFKVRHQEDAGAATFRDPVCEMVLLHDEIVARVELDGRRASSVLPTVCAGSAPIRQDSPADIELPSGFSWSS